MNRITKKLVLSILTVVLTVVALGTTTFAWFTLGNVVELEAFSAELIADDGIEISLDGKNWRNFITKEMIVQYLLEQANPDAEEEDELLSPTLTHITSTNGKTFTSLTEKNTSVAALPNQVDGGYIAIKLFFRSAVANDIYWTDFSLIGASVNWLADVQFKHSDNIEYGPNVAGKETVLVDAANAIRISVVGNIGSEVVHVVERFDNTNGNTILGDGTENGFYNSDEDKYDGKYDDAGQASYYKAKTNVLPFGQVTATTKATAELEEGVKVLVLDKEYAGMPNDALTKDGDYLGSIMIYVWVEGYDNEAYNSILGKIVQIGLTFGTSQVE